MEVPQQASMAVAMPPARGRSVPGGIPASALYREPGPTRQMILRPRRYGARARLDAECSSCLLLSGRAAAVGQIGQAPPRAPWWDDADNCRRARSRRRSHQRCSLPAAWPARLRNASTSSSRTSQCLPTFTAGSLPVLSQIRHVRGAILRRPATSFTVKSFAINLPFLLRRPD
jgi:hypothetical protein